jgi:hypothetical protein
MTPQPQKLAQNNMRTNPSATTAQAKVQINSSTMANNAAENQRKNRQEAATHKAWYHWIW